MEQAGIDIITDGEMRRLDGCVDSYYAIIQGIRPRPVRRKIGPWGYDQQTLKAHITRRTKATCAGPLTFGSRIHPGSVHQGVVDVAERLAEVVNQALKGLAAVGADFTESVDAGRPSGAGESLQTV
jgi:methionine synthase II (cobalamin-independent)